MEKLYTYKESLDDVTAYCDGRGHQAIAAMLDLNGMVVFEWDKAPTSLKEFCNLNGGDEDWIIIVRNLPQDDLRWHADWSLPTWIQATDSCREPDVYRLSDAYIIVGSHA